MARQGDSDTIKVPRPDPGQYVIAACAEDGAIAWIKVSADGLQDAPFLSCVASILDEAQQRLRDEHPKAG